jgi:hypothetical protein
MLIGHSGKYVVDWPVPSGLFVNPICYVEFD